MTGPGPRPFGLFFWLLVGVNAAAIVFNVNAFRLNGHWVSWVGVAASTTAIVVLIVLERRRRKRWRQWGWLDDNKDSNGRSPHV